jgi:hypothetical protein
MHDECVRHLSGALRAGSVRVDSKAIGRCEAAIKRQVASCDWVAPTLITPPPECRDLVVGLVNAGEPCVSSLECAGVLHCEGQGASSPGVCRAPQPIGAACGVGVDSLATYLSARRLEEVKPSCAERCSLATHQCEPRPQPGSACHASVNCAPDQRCREGHCETRTAGSEGEACDGTSCAAGHHCVAGRCTSRSLAGQACRSDLDCAVGGCTLAKNGEKRCGMKCESALGAPSTRW